MSLSTGALSAAAAITLATGAVSGVLAARESVAPCSESVTTSCVVETLETGETGAAYIVDADGTRHTLSHWRAEFLSKDGRQWTDPADTTATDDVSGGAADTPDGERPEPVTPAEHDVVVSEGGPAEDDSAAPEPTPRTPSAPDASNAQSRSAATYADALRAMVNEARLSHGLAPVQESADISAISQDWAESMAARGALGHSTTFGDRIMALGADRATENVVWASHGSDMSARELAQMTFDSWMGSPGHRANILDPDVTYMGAGVAFTGSEVYAAQNFGNL